MVVNKDPYRNSAKWYDTLFEPFNTGLRGLCVKMLPPREGMFVLDMGCGTGSQLDVYQKAGCEVFGIDPSVAMIDLARQKLGNHANLCVGDASRMPYGEGSFDLIVVSLVLHEISSRIRSVLVSESRRVLKKDGRLLVVDYHAGPLRFPKGWLLKSFITCAEIAAGSEHFKNYRQFMANKGVPALVAEHRLSVEMKKIVSGGNLGLFLLASQ
ncbi:MAG: class I SAM-dependent methyltransferase [Candidatus Neomarinimicrobiota bacterium]